MKILYFSTLLTLLFSCHNPKRLQQYIIKIYRDDYDSVSKKYVTKVYKSTIPCKNDTEAYNEGFIDYYVRVWGEQHTDFPLWKTKSFIVQDKNGINIKLRLSKRVTNDIEARVIKIQDSLMKIASQDISGLAKTEDAVMKKANTPINSLLTEIKVSDSISDQELRKKHGRYKGKDARLRLLDSLVNSK